MGIASREDTFMEKFTLAIMDVFAIGKEDNIWSKMMTYCVKKSN